MIRITHINFTDMDALSGARVVIEYISDSGVTQEMSAKLGDVHQDAARLVVREVDGVERFDTLLHCDFRDEVTGFLRVQPALFILFHFSDGTGDPSAVFFIAGFDFFSGGSESGLDVSRLNSTDADAVLFIVDGRFTEPGAVEKKLLELCKENNKKVVLAVNKSDDVSKESLLPLITNYSGLYDFVDIVPISAKTGDNVDVLLNILSELLPEGPRLFDSEYMTDQSERTISAELIREQILHFVDQEIPHGTAVEIDSFEDKYDENSKDEYDRECVVIKATIICEKDSHKAIIIGKNGQMIKRIGTSARINIERLVGCKVYLELFVKVREDWKNNDTLLKSYGFRSEEEN